MSCKLELKKKITSSLPKCTFQHLKQIHALIVTTFLAENILVFTKFLRRSTEFGRMDYSDHIFSHTDDYMRTQSMIWNVMVRGYAFNGPIERSLLLFDEMPERGLKPNNYTYPYVLNACSELEFFEKGKKVHSKIIKSGFGSSQATLNSLFDMYRKMPSVNAVLGEDERGLNDARMVFDEMPVKHLEVWNRMISEYLNVCDIRSARQLFQIMPEKDAVSWNSIISGYAKVGEVNHAREVFDLMPAKNIISWTSMLGAYASTGDMNAARNFFHQMPQKNTVSWNLMISSYNRQGKFFRALNTFQQMRSAGVLPDSYTFTSVLSACSNSGDIISGKHIHYSIKDFSELEIEVGTALIEMYARCGDIDTSFSLFIKMAKKDVFCWNVMIKSLASNSRTEDAIKLFFLMKKTGLKPNDFTFTSALFACSHGGLVEEGCMIFYSMLNPKLEHFCCLIDMLSRNGYLKEAQILAKYMPFKPDVAVCAAVLGGCRSVEDLKMAEKMMREAAELKPDEAGVFVILSNIYASLGRWNDAVEAREKMEEHKISKQAGRSTCF